MSTKIRIGSTMLAQHPDPQKKLCQTFFLPESTKGRLSLKQDKNMKVRFHGEKREYVGTLFLGGQPAGTQQGDFCVTWKGGEGVRWITGDTVSLHFRNPITVLGGVREGGGVNAGQCRAGKGGERGRSPSSVQMPLPLQLPVGFVAPLLKTYLSWTITSFTKESWSLKNLI